MSTMSSSLPQPSSPPTIDYESFLLRLRRTNGPRAGACRIYLHDIRDGEEHYFNSLRELMVYLQDRNPGEEERGARPPTCL